MKYAIHIAPVTENKSAVKRILKEIMGPGKGSIITDLINNGGVVARDLNNEAAGEIANKLMELMVAVEIQEMEPVVNLNDLFNFQFNGENGSLTFEFSGGFKVTLSNHDQNILLADSHGNKILMDANGISIESVKDLNLKALGDFKVEAADIEIKSWTNLKLNGIETELSSSGTTSVKGSLIQIN